LAVPQLVIYLVLFSAARLVAPFITPEMIADFSVVGGIVEFATGMRIAGVKRDVAVTIIITAKILIFPISVFCAPVLGI